MTIAMQAIYTQTADGNTVTFSYNNIPQSFTDLMLVISARTLGSSANQGMYIQLSNDSGLNYSGTVLRGLGTSANSYRLSSTNAFNEIEIPNALNTVDTFSNTVVYFPNYTSSNFKQVIIDSVKENNAASTAISLQLRSQLWRNTNPITSINMGSNITGPIFAANSTFTLYGITKG